MYNSIIIKGEQSYHNNNNNPGRIRRNLTKLEKSNGSSWKRV